MLADDGDGNDDGDEDGKKAFARPLMMVMVMVMMTAMLRTKILLNTPTLEVLPNLVCQFRPEAKQLKTGAEHPEEALHRHHLATKGRDEPRAGRRTTANEVQSRTGVQEAELQLDTLHPPPTALQLHSLDTKKRVMLDRDVDAAPVGILNNLGEHG